MPIWPLLTLLTLAAIDDRNDPPPADGPIRVELAVQVLDFARINSREESFDVTAYVEARWTDPRLAKADDAPYRARPASIWHPRIYFANALEQPRDHGDYDAEIRPDGHVTVGRLVTGKFSADLDLRAFPFDRQTLPIQIGSYYDRRTVHLVDLPDAIELARGARLTDWDLMGIGSGVAEVPYGPDADPYEQVIVDIEIARRPNFYVWRVLVPMTLLVAISWLAFWFEPVGLQPQISTCMGVLISLAAFNFGTDYALPKQNYLTFTDRHALLGFVMVGLAALMVGVVHRRVVAGKVDAALKLQKIARVAFPAVYALAMVGEAIALNRPGAYP